MRTINWPDETLGFDDSFVLRVIELLKVNHVASGYVLVFPNGRNDFAGYQASIYDFDNDRLIQFQSQAKGNDDEIKTHVQENFLKYLTEISNDTNPNFSHNRRNSAQLP